MISRRTARELLQLLDGYILLPMTYDDFLRLFEDISLLEGDQAFKSSMKLLTMLLREELAHVHD